MLGRADRRASWFSRVAVAVSAFSGLAALIPPATAAPFNFSGAYRPRDQILASRDSSYTRHTLPVVAPFEPATKGKLTDIALDRLHTPGKGTAERKAILDAARAPLARQLGKSLMMVVQVLRTDGHWAYLQATPYSADGKGPFDWSGTPFARDIEDGFASDILMVLLERNGAGWRVLELVIGPTDVAWLNWAESYRLPEALFKR